MSNVATTDWPSGSANQGWPQEPSAMLMPGQVQGWPAGTQRAANSAERLLTQAVAYWDVAQYRAGDRFLRNRGTGGELLDLRLGSSIVANSNDPLYLPVADEGYVYLTGVAGNSLSVTAPATATNFIAYPLDRSVATTTGAVTGGATFTFSTTGSWRLIELLDASNVVVDTIDCDVITSGSATSFTSGIVNQTVSVNRSTTGRKSVAVPSRSKGGAPVMLLGTDDYLEVQDNWQHGLLNFQQGDSFTVVAVCRPWATPGNPGGIVAKRAGLTAVDVNAGWSLAQSGINNTWRIGDNTSLSSGTTGTLTASLYGEVNVIAIQVDRTKSVVTHSRNANDGVAITVKQIGNSANLSPLRIGASSATTPGAFGDFEFYWSAVFRGLLSSAQLQLLANDSARRIV